MEIDLDEVELLINQGNEEYDIVKKIEEKKKLMEKKEEEQNRIRYICIVIDMSISIGESDFKPTRLQMVIQNVNEQIQEWITHNPLCKVCLLIGQEGQCFEVVGWTSNGKKILEELKGLNRVEDNEISLQNMLIQVMEEFKKMTVSTQKECILILSSNCSKDHGDIQSQLELLSAMNIKINIISLSGQLHICQQISTATQGQCLVPLDNSHFKQLLHSFLYFNPPQSLSLSLFIPLAFPTAYYQQQSILCSCCNQFNDTYYKCPNCLAYSCSIPNHCSICQIGLVSQYDIIRKSNSFLQSHLHFSSTAHSLNTYFTCTGCQTHITDIYNQSIIVNQCPKCQSIFCIDCNLYIAKTLFTCPGCL